MTRRGLIGTAVAAGILPAETVQTTLGVTIDCYQFGRRHQPALEFAQYCASLGAGGIQIEIPLDLEYARRLRRFLESRGMFLDVMVELPKDDTPAFERQVQAAQEAGAVAMRAACLGGRRYEVFRSLDEWRAFAANSRRKIERAVPVAEKYRVPLGLENHKDWTVDDWASFPDRNGRYLAHTMAAARTRGWGRPLSRPESLDRDSRVRLEEANVEKCLAYGVKELGMRP